MGDATPLALEEGRFDDVDSTGSELSGRSQLAPRGVVIGGAFWHRS
jgi:dihydroorotase